MKLKLKHLTPYLPYGLKGKIPNGKYIQYQHTGLLISLNYKSAVNRFINVEEYDLDGNVVSDYVCLHEERYTPILRPLSDLVKEIKHNREEFVPIVKLLRSSGHGVAWFAEHPKGKYSEVEYNLDGLLATAYIKYHCPVEMSLNIGFPHMFPSWVTEKLCEWHFDVFGLIELGLATAYE